MCKLRRNLPYRVLTSVTFYGNISSMDIRKLRKKLGLTQVEFAERLGVSSMTVKRWEAGTARPSQLAIRQLNRLVKKAEKKKQGYQQEEGRQ